MNLYEYVYVHIIIFDSVQRTVINNFWGISPKPL